MTGTAQFWRWMSDASAALLDAGGQTVADEIEQRLRAVDGRLGVEVSDPGDPRELIFTAWSDADAFDAARELVAAAPSLPGWQIIALKPPRGFAFGITVEGLDVNAAELMFEPLSAPQDPALLGIRIYVSGATDDDDERLARALPLVLETGIGEEAAAQIDHTEYIAGAPEDDRALPIDQLLAYVQWHRKKHGL
jgi:hypothetical protein